MNWCLTLSKSPTSSSLSLRTHPSIYVFQMAGRERVRVYLSSRTIWFLHSAFHISSFWNFLVVDRNEDGDCTQSNGIQSKCCKTLRSQTHYITVTNSSPTRARLAIHKYKLYAECSCVCCVCVCALCCVRKMPKCYSTFFCYGVSGSRSTYNTMQIFEYLMVTWWRQRK